MSCNESKSVLRVEIPSLEGKSSDEVYEFFRNYLGEAEELDEYEGFVEFFLYRDRSVMPVRGYSYTNNDLNKTERWGVEYVFHHDPNGYDLESYLRISDIESAWEELVEIFTEEVISKDDMVLCNYTWYNGVDEPVEFASNPKIFKENA